MIMNAASNDEVARITIEVQDRVANYLNNRKRKEITETEDQCSGTVHIRSVSDAIPEYFKLECANEVGAPVKILTHIASKTK